MAYKVEKNNPIPAKTKFPFATMRKGDSFLETDANNLNSLRVNAVNYSKKSNSKIKFSIRKVEGGYRCYRIL